MAFCEFSKISRASKAFRAGFGFKSGLLVWGLKLRLCELLLAWAVNFLHFVLDFEGVSWWGLNL